MSASPNLRLPYLDANQNQKTVTHNAALRMLDALVNLHVASTTLQSPPATLNDGQCWIVAPGGSGAWAGKDLNVAAWQDGAWSFYAPNLGFVAYVDAIQGALIWNGTAWVSLIQVISQLSLTGLGVGTAVDPTNPLSVKLNAALFTALPTTASPAGTGDVRVKLSKQAVGGTASLLFQDAFSGRAEIGLVGDDSFHVKVSPDGATFYDSMVVTAVGGGVSFLAVPTHPTPASGDSSTKSATTAFVTAAVAAGGAVTSVAGRTGAVVLGVADVSGAAPLGSPALTGTPTAPNAVAGTNSAQVATTSFVAASFVTYGYASATYATLASPTLIGTPTAPTPPVRDNSTKLATTAYADRAAVAAIARTQVSDAAYAIAATDRTVAVTALTAARVLTLPLASAYPQGTTLTVVDESGACSAMNTLTLATSGSDTLNGAANAILSTSYGYLALESNGSNKWTVIDAPSGVVSALNGGPLGGFRNRILNGNFAANQRMQASNSPIAAGVYGHDRWKAGTGGCTYTFTAATPDPGLTITAGTIVQVIETVNVEGGVYCLSWAGTSAARVNYTATGASSTTTTAYAASPIVLPGVNAGLPVTIECGTGTLGKVQLEPGSVATPFERRPVGIELTLCQRYFWASNPLWPSGGVEGSLCGIVESGNASYILGMVRFPVVMRATPNLALYNAGVLNQVRRLTTGTLVPLSSPLIYLNLTPAGFVGVGTGSLASGAVYDFDVTASAEL